ncbi:MAG: hypothetical protein EA412_01690 [Chitinophagaceae bacterium]|nr:MAG: hypothetical protein EA412_01690 [Chitinophagaceae bacterium]
MVSSPDLHSLILALNRAEKRFLMIFLKNHAYKEYDAYTYLIEIMSKQKIYDESLIKEQLLNKNFKKTLRHFAVIKKRLYDVTLKSLRSYAADSSIENILLNNILDVKNLYEKGLFEQCEKQILKTKKIGYKYQRFNELCSLIRYEKLILENKSYSSNSLKAYEEIKCEEKELLEKQMEINHQWELVHKTEYYRYKEGFARTENDYKELQLLIENEIANKKDYSDNYKAAAHLNLSLLNYYASINDVQSCLKKIDEGRKLMEDNMDIILEDPIPYLYKQYDYIWTARLLNRDEKEVDEALKKIDEHVKKLSPEIYEKHKPKIKKLHFSFLINNLITKGDFKNACEYAEKYAAYREENNISMTNREWAAYQKNMMISSFGNKKYDKTLDVIDKLLKKRDSLRIDIFSLTLIIELITHYELKNFRLIEHKVKSAYRYLSQRNKLHKFESIMLKYVKDMIKKNYTENNITTYFKNLKKDLLELKADAFEFRYLENFDLISWLDAKIEKKDFAQLVQKRFNQRAKKASKN